MTKQVIRVRLPYEPGEKALKKVRAAQRAWTGEPEPKAKPVKAVIARGRPWTWAELTTWIARHRGK